MGTTASGLWFPDSNQMLGSLHTLMATMQTSAETAFGADTVPAVPNLATADVIRLSRGIHTVTINGSLYSYDTTASAWRAYSYNPANFGAAQIGTSAALNVGSNGGGATTGWVASTWLANTYTTVGSGYTAGASGIAPIETGWYSVSGEVEFPTNATGVRRIAAIASTTGGGPGSELATQTSSPPIGATAYLNPGSNLVRLIGGTIYTIWLWHDANAGASSPTTLSVGRRWFSIDRRY